MPEISYTDIGNGLIHLVFIVVYFASAAISMRQEKKDEDRRAIMTLRGVFAPVAAFSCLGVGLTLLMVWSYLLSQGPSWGDLSRENSAVSVFGQFSIGFLLIATSIAIIGNFRGALSLYFISISVLGLATLYSLVFYDSSIDSDDLNLLTLISLSALLILIFSGGIAYALQALRVLGEPAKRSIFTSARIKK
jgi:hypothetical protein